MNRPHIFPIVQRTACLMMSLMLMCSCLMTPKAFQKRVQDAPFDAVIVPGIPFENGQWGILMKWRVHWAVYLYKEGYTKNIVFSGSSVYTPFVESRIMSLYAQQLGVPEAHILTEERAEHSSENLYYSFKLAQKNGLKKVALATDPFQNMFLKSFKKKLFLNEITSLPMVFGKIKEMDLYTPQIDPSVAMVSNFTSLKDRQSYAVRLQGTKGKFIQFEPGDSPHEKRQIFKNVKRKNTKSNNRESYTFKSLSSNNP